MYSVIFETDPINVTNKECVDEINKIAKHSGAVALISLFLNDSGLALVTFRFNYKFHSKNLELPESKFRVVMSGYEPLKFFG